MDTSARLAALLLVLAAPALGQSDLRVVPGQGQVTTAPAAPASRLTTEPLTAGETGGAALPPSTTDSSPASRSSLSIAPAQPGTTAATPLPAGTVTTGPGQASRLGPAVAAPASRVMIEPTALSRTTVVGLPVSSATTEPLSGSSVAAAQIRSELGAVQTERGLLISLPGDVLFDFDKADIRRDARPVLAKLAELIVLMPGSAVLIEGHTDAKGSEDYNQRLSERRASSVADWLIERHDVPRRRLRAAGQGETVPVAPNVLADGSDDPEGRQRNRRVEVVFESG